jgi:hypothetical protein
MTKIESIDFPSFKYLTVNGSWTAHTDQFFTKIDGFVYVLDYWLDKTGQRLGWCGAFRKLNEPTSLIHFHTFGSMSYHIKKKVIESAIPKGVWLADWREIVEESLKETYPHVCSDVK